METSFATVSDNDLVEFSKTNPDAFGELVRRYQDRLFRYVRRISYFGNEDGEDILQEVFLKMYRGLNSFDGDLKFSTWAYGITHNAVVDAIRKKQARPQTVYFEVEDVMKLFPSDEDLGAHIEAKEAVLAVRRGIEELPHTYREAMVLRFLEEKSYEEMMDILQKPKGTVATLVARGRKMLIERVQKKIHRTE